MTGRPYGNVDRGAAGGGGCGHWLGSGTRARVATAAVT